MIIRFPTFYENFTCIGGDCKKSCCIGWELDVDSETYDYYMSVPGKFGDRIRNKLQTLPMEEGDESHCFLLPENGRCPFLNDKNLCDIVINLGDEALCDICGSYPRYSFSYGNILEKSLSVSCEEVARLLFNEKDGLSFTEIEVSDDFEPDYEDTDVPENDTDEYYTDPTPEEIDDFEKYKNELFSNLKDRSTPLSKRLGALTETKNHLELNSRTERLRILSLLEPIDSDWVECLVKLQDNLDRKNKTFSEVPYENLIIYFLFRYLPRGLYDGNINNKIRFALFSIYCIRDLEEIYGDVALAASAYSREVEHSEENIELLMEELLFN